MSFQQKVAQAVKGSFTVIGVVTVSGACLAYLLQDTPMNAGGFWGKKTKLPKEFILELDLDRCKITEKRPNPFEALMGGGSASLPMRSTVESIEKAGNDDRVKGLMATGTSGLKGMAKVQELRDAVMEFSRRKNGKARSMYFAEEWGGVLPVYFSSAFDKVVMQPTGMSLFTGVATVVPFMRSLLDKYKVQPWFLTREEYKNAPAVFTDTTFTEPHREALQAVLNSVTDQIIEGISEKRDLSQADVRSAIDTSPMSAKEALKLNLLDKLMYRDEAYEEMQGKDLPRVSLREYIKAVEREEKREKKRRDKMKSKIAVVTGNGNISPGWQSANQQNSTIAAGKLVKELQEIRRTAEIKAVVVRLNTPGGSAVASDAIRRELMKLREAGKAVVVSMGDVAASGGYYIATGADKVVAQPGTLTGSIGVVVGKFNFAGLLGDNGVNAETVSVGRNAAIFLPVNEVDPEQEEVANKLIDEVYHDFLGKVCESRKISQDEGRKVARGRVWSGRDGFNLGLVDKLGGLGVAISTAIELAGLSREQVSVVDFPEPKKPLAQLLQSLSGADGDTARGIPAALAAMLLGCGPWDVIMGRFYQSGAGSIDTGALLAGGPPSLVNPGFQMWSLDAVCLHEGISR